MTYYLECLECELYKESENWDELFEIAKAELSEGHTSITLHEVPK